MEPTNIQGVLIIKGWDLEAQVLSLLLATARLIDSPSRESALEPPFLGCGRREEEEETGSWQRARELDFSKQEGKISSF